MNLTKTQLKRLLAWFTEDTHRIEGDGVPERMQRFREVLFPAMRKACSQYGIACPTWLTEVSRDPELSPLGKGLVFVRRRTAYT